jgi:ribose-phosphate pyrophosphokinase
MKYSKLDLPIWRSRAPIWAAPSSLKNSPAASTRLAVIENAASALEVVKAHVVGEIGGRNALIIDDMISTAGSVRSPCRPREYGAKSITVMATHPVFCGRACERLNGMQVRELLVCDTIE